jgi:hypothetical protein
MNKQIRKARKKFVKKWNIIFDDKEMRDMIAAEMLNDLEILIANEKLMLKK